MMRLDHTKENEDQPETSPHREGTGRAMQGTGGRRGSEPTLAPQGDRKVRNSVGFGGRGGLFSAGELLDPLGEIQIQHVDADRAFTRVVRLAARPSTSALIKAPFPQATSSANSACRWRMRRP